MDTIIPILKSDKPLTPYRFYTDFLQSVATSYKDPTNKVVFKMFENGDEKEFDSTYRIDPISIPLLLSLMEQLCKYHKEPLKLLLFNNSATKSVLEFLYRADFFNVAGNNNNPIFPFGRNVVEFNDNYLGAFLGKTQRSEHRVRAYSLHEDGLKEQLLRFERDEEKRDYLNSHFTYKVKEHFGDLLFENEYTSQQHNSFIDILSELITNGVMHSNSETYALMFSDRFATKFSISDNGIGLSNSMLEKENTFYYTSNSLKKEISKIKSFDVKNERVLENLYVIFEVLYYSSLKDREGLFDLIVNVVLLGKGYFRIHTDNCQVVISNRMMNELIVLNNLRKEIVKLHSDMLLGLLSQEKFKENLTERTRNVKQAFIQFYIKALEKFSHDIKYSSIRFYGVRYRGVHIEVEIPNA
ncbi:hypothetical protein [Marinifilum fragile]|uniref:hypothetical protein n=1 Tax=Marinifilum fragile TaxID=570161 RepID=UPI002AA962C9|nr:hypothetical protein [Marinifilum fragile]